MQTDLSKFSDQDERGKRENVVPLIYVDTLDDPRLDAFARLTEAQLRSKLEPERALFIAESQKVIERAFEGGMEPISLLMEEKWLPSMAPLIERMEARRQARARELETTQTGAQGAAPAPTGEPETPLAQLPSGPDSLPVFVAPHDELARLTGFELTRGALGAFRRSALPTVAERKRQALELLARWGEQNTNRALAILATGGDTAEAEKLLAVQSDYIRRRFDCSDFYLVYYPYILRTFGKRGSGILSEKTENELTDCLLGFRYWIDEPGNDAMWFWSENHALMFHTCQLLAGELFPDEVFTNSGLTGRQMQAKAKNMLYDWFVTFRKEGFTEWNSSPYLPIDTLGFGSLYAFAQDPAMRELGREGMDFAYYLLAVHSQQGIFASSSGRTYIKEQFGNWSNCPSGLSWIGYGYGVPGHAGKGITSYCLSDYEPPKEFAQWFSIPRGKEMICQTTQGNDGYVDLYTYKTADYMMTSANDFHPGEPGHQENPFQLTFNAVAQLWVTHPGERVLFGAARPSYWAGNGTLPKVNQYKAFAGLIYDIAPEHPVDFTHLYLPSMEFDRCEVEGKWAFVQLGSAYAAVYCSNGMRMQDFGSNKDRECIAEGRRCIWLVRAAQADEFAAFEDFKAAMRGAALDADAEGRRYRFVDPVYGELRCQWGETLYVNDAPMQYSGFDNYGKLTMQEK